MKIDGEDIKAVADQAQSAGHTVEPALRAASNVMGEVGRRLVHPMSRKARLVEFKEAVYENGEDWTAAEDGALTVNTSVSGATTIDLPEPVEFIHFGKVFLDRSPLFPCPKVDDTAATLVPPTDVTAGSDIPAHGLMYRGALHRETVLLGGFIRAQMDALIAEEKSKGVIGVLAQVIADLTGSAGGTQDKANAVDLNPHLKKVIEAGKKVNRPRVDYPTLHEAGIMLHTARRAYHEYLVTELEKRTKPISETKSPGGGILNDQVAPINEALQAGHDWFGGHHDPNKPAEHDAVPKLTALVPPGVQDFLSLVQKISFKAWDVCAALNLEYSIRLEPLIEEQCRQISITSIKSKVLPIYPVWFLQPQAEYTLPADVEQRIFDRVDNPITKDMLPKPLGALTKKLNELADVVTDPVKKALQDYDAKVGIDKTLDFLSRPDHYTPGRPFLDDIFLIPPDADAPEVPDATKRARVGWSGGLGQMAVDSLKGALGLKNLPGFLEWIISKVSTVCAEFIRAVYCRLLTMKDSDEVTEAEMHEAAERHLVGNIIESILGGLKFTDKLRMMTLDIPIAEVAISTDALIGRAKEFAAVKMEQFVAPVIKFAMRDLYGMIFAYRKTAIENRALTMEVHLAQLPTVFSRLFRNVFFPLWDKVLERAIEAVSASLMPRVLEAGHALLKAREQVEQVRGKIVQGLAALETLPAALPDVAFNLKDAKGSIKKIKSDWNPIVKNAKDAWDKAEIDESAGSGPLEHDELEQAFPLQQRILKCEAMAVTPRHLRLVAPELKWKGPEVRRYGTLEQGAEGDKPDTETPNGPRQPNGTTPGGHTPNGHTPNGHTPGHAPSGHTPNGHTPNGPPNHPPHNPPSHSHPIQSHDVGGIPISPSFPMGNYPLHSSPTPPLNTPHGGYQFMSAEASGDYDTPSQLHQLPSQQQHFMKAEPGFGFSDPPTADLPPGALENAAARPEQTQELEFSSELHELANLHDVESTVDIAHVGPSALPPFLGPKNKA